MSVRTKHVRRNNHLEEAIALLLHTQATFLSRVSDMDGRMTAIDRRIAHIEDILVQHGRLLAALPDAIREKIGFKPSKA